MNTKEFSEDRLNLFIDEQLDAGEMNEIRQAMLDDKDLRERLCQLKAVRELVGYAYSEVPASAYEIREQNRHGSLFSRALTTVVTLAAGILLGWSTYEYTPNAAQAVSAENTFRYVASHVSVNHQQRKIILHIDSGDMKVVGTALNEADILMATYRKANMPIKLDLVTNKAGINMLRPGVSPYIERVQKLINDDGVSVYACKRSITRAAEQEGAEIILLPGVTTDKAVRDLVPERLENGWVYIKA